MSSNPAPPYVHQHRVRYRECDRMGVVYHSHYLDYFEAARTEALRSTGISYRELEDSGVIMPVVDLGVTYRRPAHYDDLLAITCYFPEPPTTRLVTSYEVRRDGDDEVLVTGRVTLCFVDSERGRPVEAPEAVRTLLPETPPET